MGVDMLSYCLFDVSMWVVTWIFEKYFWKKIYGNLSSSGAMLGAFASLILDGAPSGVAPTSGAPSVRSPCRGPMGVHIVAPTGGSLRGLALDPGISIGPDKVSLVSRGPFVLKQPRLMQICRLEKCPQNDLNFGWESIVTAVLEIDGFCFG